MEMFQQLFVIALVLGTLCGGVWLLKRKGLAYSRLRRPNGASHQRMEVIDRLALSQHHSLHLVRLGDRTLLVGLSPNDCKLLESGREFGGLSQEGGFSQGTIAPDLVQSLGRQR